MLKFHFYLINRKIIMANRNEQLFERAKKIIPGGVNSPVRAFGSVGGVPRFIRKAQGGVCVGRKRAALH